MPKAVLFVVLLVFSGCNPPVDHVAKRELELSKDEIAKLKSSLEANQKTIERLKEDVAKARQKPSDDQERKRLQEELVLAHNEIQRLKSTPSPIVPPSIVPKSDSKPVPEKIGITAQVTYLDGRTVELKSSFIDYEFGASDTAPTGGFSMYSPTKAQLDVLHFGTKNGDVTNPHAIPLNQIEKIQFEYDTDEKNSSRIKRKIIIEQRSGEKWTDPLPYCKALAKKPFTFQESLRLVGTTTQGGDFVFQRFFWQEVDVPGFHDKVGEAALKAGGNVLHNRGVVVKKAYLKETAAEHVKEIKFGM